VLKICVLLITYAVIALPASAQMNSPVAIVEDASDNAPIDVFNYLLKGDKFVLSDGATVVIGYMSSCRRESVKGGTVTVGEEASSVEGGIVDFEIVDCDGGQIDLSNREAAASGVVVFRGTEEPEVTLYSATPAFTFLDTSTASELEIVRIDRPGDVLRVPVQTRSLDLLSTGDFLAPGGLYEARYGENVRRFDIVVYAGLGGPLVGRLVEF
jgi:hypothetical protein